LASQDCRQSEAILALKMAKSASNLWLCRHNGVAIDAVV
jgi:hypothetical protein